MWRGTMEREMGWKVQVLSKSDQQSEILKSLQVLSLVEKERDTVVQSFSRRILPESIISYFGVEYEKVCY